MVNYRYKVPFKIYHIVTHKSHPSIHQIALRLTIPLSIAAAVDPPPIKQASHYFGNAGTSLGSLSCASDILT